MITTPNALAAAFALSVAGMLASPAASALTFRHIVYNGASNCAPALPVGQPQIAVRPYGIYNIGPNANYVSCSFPIDYISDTETFALNGEEGPSIVIYFENVTAISRTANCAITGGTREGFIDTVGYDIGPTYIRSEVLPAKARRGVSVSNIDRVSASGTINVSCLLPPGVELNSVRVTEHDAGNQL